MDRLLPFAFSEVVDVALVAVLLWLAIVALRRSGATLALVGLAILGGVYMASLRFELELTTWILRGFFAAFVIVVVVVFQEDIRRLFEQIAVWGLRRRPAAMPHGSIDVLVRAVARLANERIGALIVIPGREPLERHLDGGIDIGARISEPLVVSIFEPHSPGHDGAVVIGGERVTRFAVHLPLSDDRSQIGQGGTRHAAALGLSERSDALAICVSEERGTVSVARDGRLVVLHRPEALIEELRRFSTETNPPGSSFQDVLRRWPEALVSVAFALALWMVFVAGQGVVEAERRAPVVVENLPEGFELVSVEPREVTVRVEGKRNQVYLASADSIQVRVDAVMAPMGRKTFAVTPNEVDHPEELRVLAVDPIRVRVEVRRVAPG
jgi:uncharacterized protein (TIGR00159 family)